MQALSMGQGQEEAARSMLLEGLQKGQWVQLRLCMTLTYAGTVHGSGPRGGSPLHASGRSPEGSVGQAEIVNDPYLCRHCLWVRAKRRRPDPCSWMAYRKGSGSCFRTAISQVLVLLTAETSTDYIVLVGQKSYH
jgi:hypothetical protein